MQGQYLEKQANGSIFLTKVKEGYLVENREHNTKVLRSCYKEAARMFYIWSKNQGQRWLK